MKTKQTKIIHVDMDAFYASVEQRDNPEWRGKPLAVGGSPTGRGVVAAASYEARRYGVRSAMSAKRALVLCPHLIFCRGNFQKYRDVSAQLQRIYREVTDVVEPLALDEAYLDVTTNKLGEPVAKKVAIYLKARIRGQTGLTASAGVAPNKFLAKLGSEHEKPNGLVVIPPDAVDKFLEPLPVERLWGVGPATAKRLRGLGFKKIIDLRRVTPEFLYSRLGKHGPFLWELAHGRDTRLVRASRVPKSRGAETTFPKDLADRGEILKKISEQAERVALGLIKKDLKGRQVQLKLRYSDFTTVTRQKSLEKETQDLREIRETAESLFDAHWERGRPLRLVGVSVAVEMPRGPDSRQMILDFDASESPG
ncbi:MAG: DNA polymerase IV [Bdellovibrionales bacterium]|nr:DNA polymerase IV [Bdellovibrionales bacterium]